MHRHVSPWITQCILSIGLAPLALSAQGRGPNINDRFPIKEPNSLSPPIVGPIGECAQAVHVSGFLPHALVRVQVNGVQEASAQPYFAEADINLPHPLVLNDKVTATQEVLGITSAPSVAHSVASAYPALNKPVVGPDLFSCGQIVPVNMLNPGTGVDVFRNGTPPAIGHANATEVWEPIFTQSLNEKRQSYCSSDCVSGPCDEETRQPGFGSGQRPSLSESSPGSQCRSLSHRCRCRGPRRPFCGRKCSGS